MDDEAPKKPKKQTKNKPKYLPEGISIIMSFLPRIEKANALFGNIDSIIHANFHFRISMWYAPFDSLCIPTNSYLP